LLSWSRHRRGFTLLELMIAVVILLILSSLAVTFLLYGAGRARMNNAVFDMAALSSSAQLSAMSRGTPHYLLVRQTADGDLRLHVLERPDTLPVIDWNALDLSGGPEAALEFDDPQDVGPAIRRNAFNRGQLVLGASTGPDSGGLAFLDLDSARIPDPLPAPYNNLPTTTAANPAPARMDMPTPELLHGCSFCINPSGEPYGVIRFNPNGTVQVMTGGSQTGGVIAFMPNRDTEAAVVPRLLTIAAPSGAINVF
jgi:prepilin-type N-terminal cleavage/methylation domain-containing protein